ncbi:hypothetical protein ALQ98_05593 [Pseudomonas syringae pv. lapsa]|uniref:Uncharacterized protein n=1 Tax=Pseudomonas syringae pv. lapsa TaxID=199201 RepID=A0AB74A3K6_PSESX|nr:hypothetical protein ALQ98_05593 [Pseudomonas syringae pv. lapsa]
MHWPLPRFRAAPRPRSTYLPCTSAPWAFSALAMLWAARCWPSFPVSWPRSSSATGSSARPPPEALLRRSLRRRFSGGRLLRCRRSLLLLLLRLISRRGFRCGLFSRVAARLELDYPPGRSLDCRLVIVSDDKPQHADHLAVLGQHPHLPASRHVLREVLLARPGAIAFLAAAVDIQRDAVHLFAFMPPHMVDTLIQATRRVDGGVRIQAAVAQLLGADQRNTVARRTVLVIEVRADRYFGQPQRRRWHPGAQQPARSADGQDDADHGQCAAPGVEREIRHQAGRRQQHRHAQGQFVTLGGGQVQDDRQRGQQCGEQRQGVQRHEQPAPGRQPFVVEGIDDRNQPGSPEHRSEHRLTTVPGGGDEKERQHEEQAFLMDHLRAVAQQTLRDLTAQRPVEQPDHGVFDHQPQPTDQHHHRDPGCQPCLAIDQNETGDTGNETKRRNEPRIALHQVEHGCHIAIHVKHRRGHSVLFIQKNAQRNNAARCLHSGCSSASGFYLLRTRQRHRASSAMKPSTAPISQYRPS